MSAEEVTRHLGVDPGTGLSPEEASQREEHYGPNTIHERSRRPLWRILLDQFTDFMILVLVAAAVVAALVGDPEDALAVIVIVLLNGVLGFVQEYRAERAIAALKSLAAPHATVRRSGHAVILPSSQVVPGDIVIVEAGKLIPADLRLLEAMQLKVNESALTGESVPIEKQVALLGEPKLPLGDRRNMAYKGALVTYGRGSGVVVATGMQTELGKIATLLSSEDEVKTPLQKRLAEFGQRLALAALVICVIVFAVGIMQGKPVVLMFLTAISLAVAAIPEALPAVVTIALALGARDMVRQQALIRRLPAVETLGSVTYICSDKTGTLTQNMMRVEQVYVAGGFVDAVQHREGASEPVELLYQAMALNNDATEDESGTAVGDPTEVALFAAASRAERDRAQLGRQAMRVAELPFDSDRKCMTTFHSHAVGLIAFTKGAPEQVLAQCNNMYTAAGPIALTAAPLLATAEQMAADGLRVLAFAFRLWPEPPRDLSPTRVETGLTCLGLVGLMDPPRAEAQEAVAQCQSAGITPVMITGDHPATARAIAARLGIVTNNDAVMTGQELERLSPQAFSHQAAHIRVYARVAPAQKIRIVRALQDNGEFVAMTGDGVNDAPALQRADIGVAMGRSGTDVAREAAHMVLLDDNFATIVAAVRAGRRIFDNIRKFIKYTMTSNAGEIWTIFLAPFLGLPIPLLPIHILWINLVTDGLPGLALAAEPEERGLMQRPPRPPRESIFAHGMWQHIIWVGLLMGAVSLLMQAWAYRTGSAHWQTMVFTTLTLSQMGHVLAIRSERDSVFQQGLLSNLPLVSAVALTFVLQLATIYVPVLNDVFKTAPLSATELALSLALSSVVFVAVEIEKWMVRHRWIYQEEHLKRNQYQ
jgi:Ca2+-transporting ATPase